MLRIFLVEDSISVRRGLAAFIGPIEGVEIVGVAEEPRAALAGIAAKHADFVIVDLRLTGGSGLEVISGLVRNSPPVITMLLTNYSGKGYREACMLAGASYFFDKTTEFDLALSVIKRIAVEHQAGTAG